MSNAFWRLALEGQDKAWAAWLLTIAQSYGTQLKVTRHVLSAHGQWTTPRLPSEAEDWSFMSLNAGLGRLFVFGDDDLALESAALVGRVGLKVTLVTLKSKAQYAEAFQKVSTFNIVAFNRWKDLNHQKISALGFKTGVYVLVTAKDTSVILPEVEKLQVGWLGLAGAAVPPRGASLGSSRLR
jgi:hypothetical protein